MHPLYTLFRRQGSLILVGSSLALAVLLTLYHNGQVRRNLYQVLHSHQVLQSGAQFLSALKDCQTWQREYLLTGKEGHLAPFEQGKALAQESLLSLGELTHHNPAQQQRLERVAALTTQGVKELERTVSLYRSLGPDSALSAETSDRGKAAMDQIQTLMLAFTDAERELLVLHNEQFEQAQFVNQCLKAGLLLLMVASLALLLHVLHQERRDRQGLLARIDAQNRALLMNTDPSSPAEAAGDAQDEAAIVDRLVTNLRSATDFILQIGQGHYEAPLQGITPENHGANAHNLAGSLLQMRSQLISVAREDKQRNWTTEGLARFAELSRTDAQGDKSANERIMPFIVGYLQANQGALFEVESQGPEAAPNARESRETSIRMIACYAYDRKKHLHKTIALGEGLVGQCVREGDTIYLTQVPQTYVRITSGLGEATPGAVVIVPLKLGGKVYGVVELASFKPFEPYQIAFLEKLAESMASTMHTQGMQQRTRTLLEESQQQAEMLRAQEEEMRQSLEELNATQEEMRRKNETMEELLEEARQKEMMMQEQDKMMRHSMEEAARLQEALFAKDQQQRQEIEQLRAAHQSKEKELEGLLEEMKVNEQDLQQNEDRFRKVLLQLQQQEGQLQEKAQLITQLQKEING